jgi:hypothetical protein
MVSDVFGLTEVKSFLRAMHLIDGREKTAEPEWIAEDSRKKV